MARTHPTLKGSVTEEPHRYTKLGWVQGKQATVLGRLEPVNVFLGIPFAAPPLGPLRFSKPQPPIPWDNLREATAYPNFTQNQHAPGNWAFWDQLAALLWVRENIKYFGGNPDSVTIFGNSAGAISISSLILSPLSADLFHRAIMQSGVAIIPSLKSSDNDLKHDLQVVANVCDCNVSDSKALLKCLREKSSLELMSLSQKAKSFTRVVDGSFFSEEPLELLSQKTLKIVPSIIGVNNQECGYILPVRDTPEILLGSNESTALTLIHTLLHIPTQHLYIVTKEYFHGKHSPTDIRDTLLDLFGDVFFVVPGLVTARYHRDSGGPVYFYEFQHRPHCFQNSRPAFVKADHTDEIRFVFGGPFLKGDVVMFEEATEEEKLLSRKMMKYWANFARSGDPNGADLPPWPVYDENEQYLELDVNISTGRRLKDQRVEFWTDTLPLILSASKALLSPTFSLILLSLLSPVLLSAAS